MGRIIYHFTAERYKEDLCLSTIHKVSGYIIQYLKKYQLEGIRFLYKNYDINRSCILNDDNGLGKTIQVVSFLEAIFPYNDTNKKCLIIVKNDERILNWKFHLNVFTKFHIKEIFKKEDVDNENIYITKWNSLAKSISLKNINFDYVIVDGRDDLLSNKICLHYLLKYYTKNISLVITSTDITIDLKLFHSILKLCGLLNKDLEDIKKFEEKFSLPACNSKSEITILESYFVRREKIINFCRDFRLRRYRHQYEDILPLVTPHEYEKSIKLWQNNEQKISFSSDSDSVKIISSSDTDTEELFNSFFKIKEPKINNSKSSTKKSKLDEKRINRIDEDDDISDDDMMDMSPLIFEPDSEDDIIEIQNDNNHNTNNNGHLENENNNVKDDNDATGGNEMNNSKQIKKRTPKKKIDKDFIRRTRNSDSNKKITRSKAQKNKYLVADISENLKRFDRVLKQRKSKNTKKKLLNSSKKIIDSNVIENQIDNNNFTSNNCLDENNLTFTNDKLDNFHKSLSNSSSFDFKIDLLNNSNIKKLQNSTEIHFNSPDIMNDDDDFIILSSSIEQDNIKDNNKMKKCNVQIYPSPDLFETITPTQTTASEITTNNNDTLNNEENIDDFHITCAQNNNRLRKNLKENENLMNRSINNNIPTTKSCIIILEKNYKNKLNKNSITDSDHHHRHRIDEKHSKIEKGFLFKAQTNKCKMNEDKKISEISSSNNSSPLQQQQQQQQQNDSRDKFVDNNQSNKITNYLISDTFSDSNSNSNDSITQGTQSDKKIEYRRNSEIYHRTPKRHKSTKRLTLTSTKKSPKFINSKNNNVTPNSLTKWLIKPSTSENNSSKKTTKRRLDVSFQNL